MPYRVVSRDGKFRIVYAEGENEGEIARNDGGTALDGGGHATRAEAERQLRAVEMHEHKSLRIERR